MSVEEHKALVRRFYEELAPDADLEPLVERVADDFVNHASPPGLPQGKENARAVAAVLAAGFSDQRYEVHHLLGEGDRVVLHCTWHATHTGEFLGIPATGKRISVDQVHIFRIAGDQVAEHWAVRDDLDMLRQMGIAPG